MTPYLLRHSFATIAWSIGVEKDVARRILRHTDLMTLENVYCRPLVAELWRASRHSTPLRYAETRGAPR